MTDNADIRRVKIVSLASEKSPVGVNHTLLPWQAVSLNGPNQQWVVRKVGENRYRLSVDGYPYTGVLKHKVIVSNLPEHDKEWSFIDAERQGGFNIKLADSSPSIGWKRSENNEIVAGLLIAGRSYPPVYPSIQLFQFQPVE